MDKTGPLLLYVEDEAIVALTSVMLLEEAGFEVMHVMEAEEAFVLLEKYCEDLGALVTDIRLPGDIDGWEVARRARELCPPLPVVYVSGDSGADWASQGVPNSLMVEKPYAGFQLTSAVASLLDQPPALPN
jgi:CheY-like chemotaxis protein